MFDLRFISEETRKMKPVFELDRPTFSQQRLYFDLIVKEEKETLMAGDSAGNILFCDSTGSLECTQSIHSGALTNTLMHPVFPMSLATYGERPLRDIQTTGFLDLFTVQ